MLYEVSEVCPYCDYENVMEWDIDEQGYVAHCQRCGEKMMLCDECFHADDNKKMKCDWSENGCFRENK